MRNLVAMITFDRRGLLVPNTIIQCTLSELYSEFVENIESKTRSDIYSNYVDYSDKLKELLGVRTLKQWINGSFVTKIAHPKDIDFVTFIESDLVERFESELKNFTSNDNLLSLGVDSYIIKVYDENAGSSFFKYQSDMAYWIDKFDKTRRNRRTGVKSPKGFLEIEY